ncbi:WhiB family transcriptional regulator [Gemmatimonas sp.]|uniref:WhiB family transcriptional regulator n=1 Tax=Gemmatimonas sp. TaxID=1962908 RepID=UPI003569246D
MPRNASYSGSFDEMPLSVQRAASVPRDWYDQALCRNDNGFVKWAWIAEEKVTYKLGTQKIKGHVLHDLALTVCAVCPVQWECALGAIQADERAGVWGEHVDRLRFIANSPHQAAQARAMGFTVQEAVQRIATGIS